MKTLISTERNMNDLNRPETRILFSKAHHEQLDIALGSEDKGRFTALRQFLVDLGYTVDYTEDSLTLDELANVQVLVIGAPKDNGNSTEPEREEAEVEAIRQFVTNGGGLLITSNADTMLNPPPILKKVAAIAGLEFHEYLNYPPTFLQIFWPHYVTANIKRVRIGRIAALATSNGAKPLALTKATRQMVVACAHVERGRVVAVGDLDWFADDLLAAENNRTLVANIFRWLVACNVIDVVEITIPETVRWGQAATVVLQLRNVDPEARPKVECILESDADALISEPTRRTRSIPPGGTTRMQWTVRPQVLGEQNLRLAINIKRQQSLFFDQLPEMLCLAPGHFTLEIRDKAGELKTAFRTGDYFTVEGVFHWVAESEPLPYQLELQTDEGLVIRNYEHGNGIARWHLKATAPGEHKLTLRLMETGQSLPGLVKVRPSTYDQLSEIKAAYLYPVDAEIAERLRQVDESLSHALVRSQPFEILSPEAFVEAVYKGDAETWLQGVVAAARREQWYNPNLLDLFLTYIAPTYLAAAGSFIPYDPGLASHLAQLHPSERRNLEYNLLCSEESEEIQVKQNVAAYLLHEKYGHGFFYTQTRLGQQLAILQRHSLTKDTYKETDELLKESAIIVNEGFATWLELTFLARLDQEVRQAVHLRRIFLVQEGSGLYELEREGSFFEAFPPRFDSRYREGFEYLDYISQTFNLRCAVRAFLIATNVEFGITENVDGSLHFTLEPAEIKRRLLDPEKPDWRSHFRLRDIAELLHQHRREAKAQVQQRHCPADCCKNGCPLEAFIADKLGWRAYETGR